MLPDDVTLQAFPLLAVPGSGNVPSAEQFGTRYLVARDGLYRQTSLPWMEATLPMGPGIVSPTPYGALRAQIAFAFDSLPLAQLQQFKALAIAALPKETTAVIAWHEGTGAWRLVPREVKESSAAHVGYHEAELGDGEHLVIDVHSHGNLPAYFSDEDDRDDRGGMKIAAVLGEVNTETPKLVARLVLPDRFIPLYLRASGAIAIAEGL